MTKFKKDIIDHLAITVKDIKKSAQFYNANFNCTILYQDSTWAILEFANVKLSLVKSSQHPPHFAILDDEIKKDITAKTHRDNSVSKYIKDIDGNFIELLAYDEI